MEEVGVKKITAIKFFTLFKIDRFFMFYIGGGGGHGGGGGGYGGGGGKKNYCNKISHTIQN